MNPLLRKPLHALSLAGVGSAVIAPRICEVVVSVPSPAPLSCTRTRLVAYRSTVLAPAVAEAMRLLEVAAASRKQGLRVEYAGVVAVDASWVGVGNCPGPLSLPAHLSLRPAGREVYLRLLNEKGENELALLWELAVPLGFVPWLRFPVPDAHGLDTVFHHPGEWAMLVDALHAEGQGEQAWPSLCAAAQVDAGTWGGDKPVERFVQAQLHRLGVSCGRVDGIVGGRTLAALKSLGLGGKALSEVAEKLGGMASHAGTGKNPKRTRSRQQVHVIVPTPLKSEGFATGNLLSSRTPQGYTLNVSGSGQFTLVVP